MANIFAITTTTENLIAEVNGAAKASIIFTVTNNTAKPVRGIARVQALEGTQDAWLSLDGEPEKDFPAGGTQQFTVNFNKPLEPLEEGKTEPEEKYPYRLNVASAVRPDEDFDEGPKVTIFKPERTGRKKRGIPWWIFLIIGIVVLALLVGGIIFGMRACSKPDDTPPPTPTPTPAPTDQVAVPSVVDFSFEVAAKKLTDAGLKVKRVDLIKADGTANLVTDQDPKADTMVTKGDTVNVTAVAASVVPDLENKKLSEVLNALTKAGLRIGNRSIPTPRPSKSLTSAAASLDENFLTVKSQSPLKNLTVPKDSKVDIVYACPASMSCTTNFSIRKEALEVGPAMKFRQR